MHLNQQICFWEIVLGVVSAVASVASTGYSIYSGVTSGNKAEESAKSQARYAAMQDQTAAEKARAEKLKRARLGKKQTWLTGGMDLGSATVSTPTLKSSLGA